MNTFRLFQKSISLRIVNIAGLSVVFACLALSLSYTKHELSYDRHHTHASRIARLSLQFDDQPVDGRILGNALDDLLQQIPEIERMVKMRKVNASVLTYRGTHRVVNDFYQVSSDFLHLFDIPLLQGSKEEALQRDGQALISETLARQLFGNIDMDEMQMAEIDIEGIQYKGDVFVSGIFKDIPETSHFHTDILLHFPNGFTAYTYVYLLLDSQTDINALATKITRLINEAELFEAANTRALLMPLADIHLHSRSLREMGINGNINYIYLVVGANALLLIVVLFNLWLNTSLIFSRNRRYYQIIRLHGAPSSTAVKDQILLALLLGIISMMVGMSAAFYLSSSPFFTGQVAYFETIALCFVFLLSIIAISLLPMLRKPITNSHSNVKFMLTGQYTVVMMVVILAFGINKQMNLVKGTQAGGNERNILVMSEMPDQVQANYALLRSELLKHTDIESVTACFQLPGDAIRDMVTVRKADDTEGYTLPLLVTGDDFLPFFRIGLIAGRGFLPGKYDYNTETEILMNRMAYNQFSEHVEEYVINRKALSVLGFATPEEALGQIIQIEHSVIDYFRHGVIVGVTDDFNYTGLYEETTPLLVMQRSFFMFCFMVRLAPDRLAQAKSIFESVWNEVNPDFAANYLFMNELFDRTYRNEMNAQRLVSIFSLLCFVVADLGLIIFMAFIIRRRTREAGIRKVHGASVGQIIKMLNIDYIRHIVVAFAIAVFAAWYILHRWLAQFAYRTSLDWWVFALAGLVVLLLSVVSVSMQSWRAATANPVNAIKVE
jgi:putative ABC transport system permease protein